jgi:hypothetical protein
MNFIIIEGSNAKTKTRRVWEKILLDLHIYSENSKHYN